MSIRFSGGGTGGGTVTVSNEVEVKNDTGSPLPVASGTLASETTVGLRFAGGKSAKTAAVTAAGDTTVLTPASGKALRIFWVSAINDPDAATTPLVTVKFAGASDGLYAAYALAHWEVFDGATNQALVVNLSDTGQVAVTIHYKEL